MNKPIILISFLSLLFISCKTTQPVEVEEVHDSLADKLMIELKPGIEPEDFELGFSEYNLKRKYLASKSKNLHMFTFNIKLISKEEIIKKISKNRQVVYVESLSDKLKEPTANKSTKKRTVEIK